MALHCGFAKYTLEVSWPFKQSTSMMQRLVRFLKTLCEPFVHLGTKTAKLGQYIAAQRSCISNLQAQLKSQTRDLDLLRDRFDQVVQERDELKVRYEALEVDAIDAVEDSEQQIEKLQRSIESGEFQRWRR